MKLITIACNNCGAPLRVGSSVNFVTCNHCNTQLTVKRDDSVTYTEKIKEIDERTEEMQRELEDLRVQNELTRLQRSWESEKENYMVSDKHGHKSIPTTTGSVAGGVMIVVFGIFWMVTTAGIGRGGPGPPGFFPMFGVIFILVGVGMSVISYGKAKEYRQAERNYRRRRSKLINKKYAKRQRSDNGEINVRRG